MNMNSNNQNSPSQPLPQPPKHWHGSFGDRYDHHNVWVTGGTPQAYYPRRASASSISGEPSMSDRRVCPYSHPKPYPYCTLDEQDIKLTNIEKDLQLQHVLHNQPISHDSYPCHHLQKRKHHPSHGRRASTVRPVARAVQRVVDAEAEPVGSGYGGEEGELEGAGKSGWVVFEVVGWVY